MATSEVVVTTTGDLLRRFSHYSDLALAQPVVVTRNDRPRNVLISIEEYERLKLRNRQGLAAVDTPEYLRADVDALAGDGAR